MAEAVGAADSCEEFVTLARFAGTEGAVEYQLARAAELIAERAKDADVSSIKGTTRASGLSSRRG